MDLSLSEHPVEPFEGLGSACEDYETGHGAVDAVGDAAEDVSGFGVFLLYILFDCLGEGSVSGLVALHDFAGAFVDHNDVIVFVYDLHK